MFIFAFMELQLGEFGLKFREWSDIVNEFFSIPLLLEAKIINSVKISNF